jgi:uncharacterized protein
MFLLVGCHTQPAVPQHTKPQINVIGPRLHSLVNLYKRKLPDLVFNELGPQGSIGNLDSLEKGVADVTFVPSDIVYRAFTRGTDTNPKPHRTLRGMTILYRLTLHLIVAPGVAFKDVRDLAGKRLAVTESGMSTDFTVRLVFSQFGIPSTELTVRRIPLAQIPTELANHSIDALFDFATIGEPLMKSSLAVPGTRLVPIAGPLITALTDEYPFLRPAAIPAGTYRQNEDTQTLELDRVLICREGLDEAIVYQMLTVLFDSIPELVPEVPELGTIRLDHAAGTPIPLHPGAARFYRERELFR